MNLLVTIKSLYAVNGAAAVLLYLPQIAKAWKDRDHALSLSLLSFGGWSVGSLITALYAFLYVRDLMFTAISIGNMIGSGAVFVIASASRVRTRRRERSVAIARDESPVISAARHEADNVAGLA
jgi:uncharacterized protein with PQ loop repeat